MKNRKKTDSNIDSLTMFYGSIYTNGKPYYKRYDSGKNSLNFICRNNSIYDVEPKNPLTESLYDVRKISKL